MTISDFYVEPASWRHDLADIKLVRTCVFIIEQQVPEDQEWDQDDETAAHFLARDAEGHPIGTARLTRDGRIGRMAVLDRWRGQGVGEALLRSSIELAVEHRLCIVRLAAQEYAQAFYARQGFEPEGDLFDDVGIPHRWMTLDLSDRIQAVLHPARMVFPESVPASARSGIFETSSLSEFRDGLIECLTDAHRRILIKTQHLDPLAMNDDAIIEAIRRVATTATRPDIRILIHDSKPAVLDGHRLILLAQRLTSVIQCRNPGREHQHDPRAWVLIDDHSEIFREFGDRYSASFRINQRNMVRQRLREFEQIWQQAEPDPDLQRLDLG